MCNFYVVNTAYVLYKAEHTCTLIGTYNEYVKKISRWFFSTLAQRDEGVCIHLHRYTAYCVPGRKNELQFMRKEYFTSVLVQKRASQIVKIN